MTPHDELRRLAEAARPDPLKGQDDLAVRELAAHADADCIIALLDEVEALKRERDEAQTISRKGSIMEDHYLPDDMAAYVRNAIERNRSPHD